MLTDAATLVRHAFKHRYAVVQVNCNCATYEITRAIIEAAEAERAPVILGEYEATIGYRGFEYAALQLRFLAERATVPVAVQLDHGGSVEACQRAIDAGFTSVMIDGSHLPIDENIALVKEVSAIAKPRGISVEAEVGELEKLNPDGSVAQAKNISDPQDVKRMAVESGCDMLAVGIGNAHGFYKDAPNIRFDALEKFAQAAGDLPLVLHGSTGLADDVVRRCVSMGMAKANLGTLIRTRCAEFTKEVIDENKHGGHPWKIGMAVKDRLVPVIRHMLALAGGTGQADAFAKERSA